MLFETLNNLTEWYKHSDSFTRREQAIENMFIKQKERERFAIYPLSISLNLLKALLMVSWYEQSNANKKEARHPTKTP